MTRFPDFPPQNPSRFEQNRNNFVFTFLGDPRSFDMGRKSNKAKHLKTPQPPQNHVCDTKIVYCKEHVPARPKPSSELDKPKQTYQPNQYYQQKTPQNTDSDAQYEYIRNHLYIKTGIQGGKKKSSFRNYIPKVINQEINMGMWMWTERKRNRSRR